MAVKMLTGMAGDNFAVSPDDIWSGTAEEEARLVAAGYAEPVEAAKPEKKKATK